MENNLDGEVAMFAIVFALLFCGAFFAGACVQDLRARRKKRKQEAAYGTYITNIYQTPKEPVMDTMDLSYLKNGDTPSLKKLAASMEQTAEAEFYNSKPRDTLVYDELTMQYDKEITR